MAMTYNPKYGLKDVVYSILDDTTDVAGGTPSYGTVYTLPNVKQLKVNPNANGAVFYADDGPAFSAELTGAIEVDLFLADLLPADESRILGRGYANGQLSATTADVSPYIALGWKTLRANTVSGSNVYDYVWLYKGKMMKPQMDQQTKADTVNFQIPELTGKFVALQSQNRLWMMRIRTDDTNVAASFITGFFTNVSLPSTDLGALSAVASKGTAGDAGKVLWTFAKVGGGNITIGTAYAASQYLTVVDTVSIRAGTYAITANGTATPIVKFTPSVSLTGVTVGVTQQDLYDQNGVKITQAGLTLAF